MAKLSDMINSKFLKKEDFTVQGFSVTFNSCERMNVAPESQPKEMKYVAYFDEFEKGLVLNAINATTLSEIFGSDNTDDWVGNVAIAYLDPNVSMSGKRTGGIRFRGAEPARRAAPQTDETSRRTVPGRPAPQRARAGQDLDDDVPF